MTDRYTRKDVDAVVEAINKEQFMIDNGLKMRYYRAYDTFRIGLILNLETGSEEEFKHELKHRGVYLCLLNFRHLIWMLNDNKVKITKEVIVNVLENCGFTYYR